MMNPAEFDNIAKAESDLWWYRGMHRIMFGMLDRYLDGRTVRTALEAGCGTGYFARLAQQRYKWPVVPVDLGWQGLEYARQLGLKRLCQCDIAALPFPAASFDVVVSLDVIVHFPRGEEAGAARELSRVLAPGGILAVRVSALDILRSRHSQFAHERQRFTRTRLKRLMESEGIRVLRCTYANSLLMPVALAKFRIWEPLLRKPPASGVTPVPGWLDRLLYAPLALESSWLAAGLNLPLGQSLILIGEKVSS
ncbi:MAG: class I SAM-dependent methyltransferase [Acidobacteria bacterium]|nr:class I SAM-dependent methyltransferase [Acidobacteriota bacterium]